MYSYRLVHASADEALLRAMAAGHGEVLIIEQDGVWLCLSCELKRPRLIRCTRCGMGGHDRRTCEVPPPLTLVRSA